MEIHRHCVVRDAQPVGRGLFLRYETGSRGCREYIGVFSVSFEMMEKI